MQYPKIHIELVPKTCWFSNVRSQVSKASWDVLRKQAYKNSNHRCKVCGVKSKLEAHEIWHYDDASLIQKLHSITAVCKPCHELYHLGHTSINGDFEKSLRHLSKVNSWSLDQTREYVNIVFEIWMARSRKVWVLDLTFLDSCKIPYKTISKEERAEFALKNIKN